MILTNSFERLTTNLLKRLIVIFFFVLNLKIVAGSSGSFAFLFQSQILLDPSSKQPVSELNSRKRSSDAWCAAGFV